MNIPLRPILHMGRIRLIGVDLHCECEVRVHSDEHVAEDELAVTGDPYSHH